MSLEALRKIDAAADGAPSLPEAGAAQLIELFRKYKIPFDSLIDPQQIESFEMAENGKFSLKLVAAQSFELKGITLTFDKNVKGILNDNSLTELEGLSASRQAGILKLRVNIVGLTRTDQTLTVLTDNKLMPRVFIPLSTITEFGGPLRQ